MFDFNRFSKHNIIGELRVELCNVDWNHVIEEWKALAEPAKFEVFFVSFYMLSTFHDALKWLERIILPISFCTHCTLC